jgi:hypothetical protein
VNTFEHWGERAEEGWDYLGYDLQVGRKVKGRIVPSQEGTIGVVYRIETLDGERVADGQVGWKEIEAQILLLPIEERGRGGTNKAVALAIAEDLKVQKV